MIKNQPFQYNANSQNSKALGKAFWSIVHLYGLSRAEQALILGIKNNGQRLLDLETKQLIPDDVDKCVRVGNLVGIHKNLRILYPHNRDLVYGFLKRPWSLLKNKKKPIDFLKEDPQMSFQRLFTIRRMLDNLRVAF